MQRENYYYGGWGISKYTLINLPEFFVYKIGSLVKAQSCAIAPGLLISERNCFKEERVREKKNERLLTSLFGDLSEMSLLFSKLAVKTKRKQFLN